MEVKSKAVKSKTELARRSRQELKVVGLEFVPTPGAEQKLARVFELLLADGEGITEDGGCKDEREQLRDL